MHFFGKPPRGLITPEEFLILSAELHYLLSGAGNSDALASLVIGSASFKEMPLLSQGIDCLRLGYGETKRKMGPLAVLHPIRAAAIVARTMPEPEILDVLGTLFHDKLEDLTEEKLGSEAYGEFAEAYDKLTARIGSKHQWYLGERVSLFERTGEESYNQYVMKLIRGSINKPDLLHTKLADRLDNTFDVHLSRPGVTRYNFYRTIFDILFLRDFSGVRLNEYHFLPDVDGLVLLLSQLFKNVIFLTLLREHKKEWQDETVHYLFDAVAVAGIREAQWIAFELLASEITDTTRQREILIDTMHYCHSGGATEVHKPSDFNDLDGAFHYYYGGPDDKTKKERLAELCREREKLFKVVVMFIALFSSMLNNPDSYLRGLTTETPVA